MSAHANDRLQQGRLLDTVMTRTWTQEERDLGNLFESRRIFRNFSALDDGLQREAVANAMSAEDAARLVACWNVCRGFDTAHLENIDMVGSTLKGRFAALQAEMKAVPLAPDHEGMMVDYSGMLRQTINALPRSSSVQAEMLRQFQGHLEELGKRFYAGDFKAVDEFLQLYCIADDDRKRVVAEQGGAS